MPAGRGTCLAAGLGAACASRVRAAAITSCMVRGAGRAGRQAVGSDMLPTAGALREPPRMPTVSPTRSGTAEVATARLHFSPRWIGTPDAVVKPIRTRPPAISSTVITSNDSHPPGSPITIVWLFFRVSTSIAHRLSDGRSIHQQKKPAQEPAPRWDVLLSRLTLRRTFRLGPNCSPFRPPNRTCSNTRAVRVSRRGCDALPRHSLSSQGTLRPRRVASKHDSQVIVRRSLTRATSARTTEPTLMSASLP